MLPFEVPRRAGLALVFATEGAAILGAIERLGLSLSVDESACAKFPGEAARRLGGEVRGRSFFPARATF